MKIKTCRHCDITFQRPDDCPIPDDRCEGCHWEIEAMKVPLCTDGRPCGQQDHPDDDAYCLKCPHEGKAPEYEPAEVALRNKYERESCDMTDEHPLDRLAQAGLVRAAAKWARGDMEAKRAPDGDSVSLSTKRHGENGNLSTSDPQYEPSDVAFKPLPKQARYQDSQGSDWIDEFARNSTPEEFRGAMKFTVGKYLRRAGKKDSMLSEVRKMRDYCQRWEQYEQELEQ